MRHVEVECDPSLLSPKKKIVTKLVSDVFHNHKIEKYEVSIIFAGDELLTKLKQEFFKKDQLTDVIAFRLNGYNESNIDGEIYISLPRAKENSKVYKEPYSKEVLRLIIHGCLHLIGFDDNTIKKKEYMTALENKSLENFNHQNIFEE
tara:strand:+ start:2071 stop:2514 length:444 start_codon:yes stop_codon:yes gene_type:complete